MEATIELKPRSDFGLWDDENGNIINIKGL